MHRKVSLGDPQTRIVSANTLLEIAGSRERVTELDMATATLAAFLHQLLDGGQYIEAALLLWGDKLFDPRPKSVGRIWASLEKYNKNLFIGSSSQGKSYTPAAWQILKYAKDHKHTSIKNVSTTSAHVKANTWSTLTSFHENAIIPLPGEATTGFIGDDPVNRRAGISVVAIPQGEDGKGRLQGFHPVPRPDGTMSTVILFIDEGEKNPVGVWAGVDNMLANEDSSGSVRVASSTNPWDISSVFAKKAEPMEGWGGIDRENADEWISREGWHVLRLDAAKSENVVQKRVIFPGMQTYEGYMNLAKRGTGDPSYWCFARGMYPPTTAEYHIMPSYILNEAIGTYVFIKTPTPWATTDPAFAEGGDSPEFTTGRYGYASAFDPVAGDRVIFSKPRWVIQVEQQFPIPKDKTPLMSKAIRELCIRLGVQPDWYCIDRTGNAQGLYDDLILTFGPILGIQWGEGATDKKILEEDTQIASELYAGVSTEMLFAAAQWIEYGYMKFSPVMNTQKLFSQFTARRYDFVSKTLRRAESKYSLKLRTGGESCDLCDSVILAPHLIRMRQATNAAMMPDRVNRDGRGQPVWNPESIRSVVDKIEFMSDDGT